MHIARVCSFFLVAAAVVLILALVHVVDSYRIPSRGRTTMHLSLHLLMGIWVVMNKGVTNMLA